jgi:hypothetical protein
MKKMTAADFVTNCEGDVIEIEDSVEAFLVHLAATLPLRRGVDRGQVKKRLLELWHENRDEILIEPTKAAIERLVAWMGSSDN